MSFAALEARANDAVMRRLSNARGDFGGEDFPIIFETGYVETGTGATALKPLATVEDARLTGCTPHQTQLRINGSKLYLVIDIQADGTGLSQLVLEVA